MEDTQKPMRLLRYGRPTKLDQASFGTQCWVTKEKDIEIYVQMNHDEYNPDWQLLLICPLKTKESYIEETIKSVLNS